MEKLLTIAIPTYNRSEKLKFCLEHVMEQAAGKPVELLVSDNASTDGTEAFMTELCKAHPEVTYVRNPENVGADRNFLNCYDRAAGEYVLLLGDDDMLLPGALENILAALEQKPVFVHLNTSALLTQQPLTYKSPRVPEGEMKVFDKPEEIFQEMGIQVTFMSSFILRNDLVRAVANKEQYVGTYFIQSHIALMTLKTAGTYIFVTKNCIAATGNETLNYDLYFVWGEMYHKLLMETGAEAGLDPELLKKQHEKDLRNTIFGFVLQFRSSCVQSGKWNKQCMVQVVKPYSMLYLRYWAAMYLPLKVIAILRKIF